MEETCYGDFLSSVCLGVKIVPAKCSTNVQLYPLKIDAYLARC